MSDEPALDKLNKKIEKAKSHLRHPPQEKESSQNLAGKFFNVGVELVSGVLVGVGFGLFIDWAFGTSPWGLISLFILGSMAGMLNVYRDITQKEDRNKKSKNG